MQPRKKKETRTSSDVTPEKTAQAITPKKVAQTILLRHNQVLLDKLIQTIKDKETSPDKIRHQLSYIEELKRIPDDEKVKGSKRYFALIHNYQVKPYLPWDSLRPIQEELIIDDNRFGELLFLLKPIPIEQTLIPEDNPLTKQLYEESEKDLTRFNKRIQDLSPLLKKLKKLSESEHYAYSLPIYSTIAKIQFDIDVSREIVKQMRAAKKGHLAFFQIDKNLKKSPQKHKYWNAVVTRALKIVNPYCCTNDCDRKQCRKTHQSAINAVAELLKILYPSIWTEDVKTIANRIKQKDYRNIPA